MRFTPLFVVFIWLLSACSSTSSVVTGSTREPIDPGQVTVYLAAPEVYEEVALLSANSENSWAMTNQGKTDVAIKRLKKEAASLGANGVLLSGVEDETGASVYASGVLVPTKHKAAKAIAIFVP